MILNLTGLSAKDLVYLDSLGVYMPSNLDDELIEGNYPDVRWDSEDSV